MAKMFTAHFSLFFSLCFFFFSSISASTTPYLSPHILIPNYQSMLNSFKIYIYATPQPISFTSPEESLFYTSLQRSTFVTQNAEEAHLFFIPFSSVRPMRSIKLLIRNLRTVHPYWNRTLGADHFFLYRSGLDFGSDRNLLELKKNSVQISCFPTPEGRFVPHKDITLPPVSGLNKPGPVNGSAEYLAYVGPGAVKTLTFLDDLTNDADFLTEPEPLDEGSLNLMAGIRRSEFCLFEYGADVSWLGEALRFGCVPVVVTGRPIQDMPLMDVLRWQELAVFVGSSGGVEGVKRALGKIRGVDFGESMRRLGKVASQHFVWNEKPEPYDAFHMVMYQLWLRRHTIRYAKREEI